MNGPGPYSHWVNVLDHGAVADDATDCAAAIQAACDANPGGTVYIPPGDYRVLSPVFTGTCNVVGAGAEPQGRPGGRPPRGTTLWGLRGRPVLVAGFGPVQYGKGPDGFSTATTGWAVGPEYRPPAGQLDKDGTLGWRALALKGDLVGVAVCNPATHNARIRPPEGDARQRPPYDHFGETPEFTFEFLFDGKVRPGDFLCGFAEGDPYDLYLDSEGAFHFRFSTVEPNRPYDPPASHSIVTRDLPFGRNARVRISFETGEATLYYGPDQAATRFDGVPIKGRRMSPNRHNKPWMLGAAAAQIPMGGGGTDLIVGGFRVSNVLRGEPASGRQMDRYTGLRTDGVVWYLDLTFPEGRWVGVQGGPESDCHFGMLALVHANLQLNGAVGGSVSDLTVQVGSPCLLLGQVLDYRVSRCRLDNGDAGIDTLRFGAVYPIDVVDTEVGGDVVAASFTAAWVRFARVDVSVFRSFTAFALCSTQLYCDSPVFVKRAGPEPETVVSCTRGNDGNVFVGRFLVDNEDGNPLIRSVLYAERGGYGFTAVRLEDTVVASFGPGCSLVELTDRGGPVDQYGPGVCVVANCPLPVRKVAPPAVRVRGDQWAVRVDAPGARPVVEVDGLSTVTVVGADA